MQILTKSKQMETPMKRVMRKTPKTPAMTPVKTQKTRVKKPLRRQTKATQTPTQTLMR